MNGSSGPSTVAEVAAALTRAVFEHYGRDARTERLELALSAAAGDRSPIDPARLAGVEAVAQRSFRHIQLTTAGDLVPQQRSPGWPPPDLPELRRCGAQLAAVTREPDGVATIRLTGLAAAAAAAPVLAGAFAVVAGADRLVLDLRDNGGGDPATLVLVVDWLIGEDAPRHLFDVVYRDRVRQWWTSGAPLHPRPPRRVSALIGPGTYSSGEALAWVLQQQRLATLVGQPTPGAADHVVPLALTHDVRALIPEARVAAPGGGPTWEGGGVQPDVNALMDAAGRRLP